MSARVRHLLVAVGLSTTLLGCPETNTPPIDANRMRGDADLDAAVSSLADVPLLDAPELDTFVCPDVDGDGETDAACGGTDCDDADAALSSTLGPCATPTATRRCVDGAVAEVECGGDTPYCDARVNECVANACGDGVMHSNEFCETDVSTCSECRRSCGDTVGCPDGETCRASETFGGSRRGACVAANLGGDPDGTHCTVDDQCYSRYCDPTQGRCVSIQTRDQCNRPGSRVEHDLDVRWRDYGLWENPPPCKYECLHESECGEGSRCMLARSRGADVYMMSTCFTPPLGTVELGGACARETDCASGVCVAERCTLVCRDDADCGPVLPFCRAVDLSVEWAFVNPRPTDWSTPWPLLCAP